MTAQQARRLVLVGILLTACAKRPPRGATSSDGQWPSEAGAASDSRPAVQALRTSEPDLNGVQHALEAALEIPVIVLGRQALRTEWLPHLDFVAFKVEGQAWCSSHLPLEDRIDCLADRVDEGVPWSMLEVLGFALIAFEDSAKPYVSTYRFVGPAALLPSVRSERPGAVSSTGAHYANLTRVELEELSADDIDGDGQQEIVTRVSHVSLSNFEGEVREVVWHKRLIISRSDLSLQADAYVYEYWDDAGPAMLMVTTASTRRYSSRGMISRSSGVRYPAPRTARWIWCAPGPRSGSSSRTTPWPTRIPSPERRGFAPRLKA